MPKLFSKKLLNCLKSMPKKQSYLHEITTHEEYHKYITEISIYNKLVIFYFYTKWKRQCHNSSQFIKDLIEEYPNVVFVGIDYDVSKNVYLKLGLTDANTPLFIFYKNKRKVAEEMGHSSDRISEIIIFHTSEK